MTARSRVVVPAVRTSLEPGEPLALEVLVLSKDKPAASTSIWRPMGRGAFAKVPLGAMRPGASSRHPSAPSGDGIEYYIEVGADGGTARFPATAPALNQTVIVLPAEK